MRVPSLDLAVRTAAARKAHGYVQSLGSARRRHAPSASSSPHERSESGADIESSQRSEAHRPSAVGLLEECVPHSTIAQRTDMPIRAFVSARAEEGRVEAIPAVINRPDSHPVWHRPSRSRQARAIVAHSCRIDEPTRVLEQSIAERTGPRPPSAAVRNAVRGGAHTPLKQVLGEIVPQLFPRPISTRAFPSAKPHICSHFRGVSDGTRTPPTA
jgi:hypothetical protein